MSINKTSLKSVQVVLAFFPPQRDLRFTFRSTISRALILPKGSTEESMTQTNWVISSCRKVSVAKWRFCKKVLEEGFLGLHALVINFHTISYESHAGVTAHIRISNERRCVLRLSDAYKTNRRLLKTTRIEGFQCHGH